MSTTLKVSTTYYPESDGRPMAETDLHRKELIRQLDLLERHYAGQQVYVTGNILMYFEEGDPGQSVSPDVMVVIGAQPGQRRVYKVWEERVPNAVIEVTSKKTKTKDTVTKPKLYARIGVAEYFLFDPTQDYLRPSLQGFRLVDGEYQPMERDATGALVSQELGLRLCNMGGKLSFERLDTGEQLLSSAEARELEERRRIKAETEKATAERDLASERKARLALEAELARMKEELRRQSVSGN